MKARVNVFQDQDGKPTYPTALNNMRQYYLGHITTVMRMFGIGHITMRPVQTGLRVTPSISFRPMAESPTDETVLAARPDVVRRLAEDMMLMGLIEIELTPEAGDMETLKASWVQLATQQAAPQPPTENKIPLNIETDPTAQAVTTTPPKEATIDVAAEDVTEVSDGPAVGESKAE